MLQQHEQIQHMHGMLQPQHVLSQQLIPQQPIQNQQNMGYQNHYFVM